MGHHGGVVDELAMKLDANGDIEWSRLFGGTQSEGAAAAIQSSSGGYAFIGTCNSEDGDAEGPGYGQQDVWILCTDPEGVILWQRKYGGPLNDVATAIRQTGDGGFLFTASVGSSTSGGDLLPGLGGYWLVKLNSTGEILWQNRFGGSNMDIPYAMTLTADGGCILAGHTWSDDGDVAFHYPGSTGDGWVVKADSLGQLQWQKTLGGTGWDLLSAVVQTEDGGYLVAGHTESNDGDVSGHHGGGDAWAVKLDASGDLLWQRALGGSGDEQFHSVAATTDGGFVLVGTTNSSDGDVSGLPGGFDGWVVKLDSAGQLQWDLLLGGSAFDTFRAIGLTADGGFLLAGESESHDGHAIGNHGERDMWVVKMGPEPTSIAERPAPLPLAVFPNPAREQVRLEYALQAAGTVRLEVVSGAGKLALPPLEWRSPPGTHQWLFDASALAPGAYHLRLTTAQGTASRPLVKLP